MSKCYTWKGKTVTEDAIVAAIKYELLHNSDLYHELKSSILNVQQDSITLIEKAHTLAELHLDDHGQLHNGVQHELWLGTSRVLELEHSLTSASGGVYKLILAPIYDKTKRIANSIQNVILKYGIVSLTIARDIIELLSSEPAPDDVDVLKHAATLILEDMIKTEETISDVGDIVHNGLEEVVKSHILLNSTINDTPYLESILNRCVTLIMNSVEHVDNKNRYHRQLFKLLTDEEYAAVTEAELKDKLKLLFLSVEYNIFNGRPSGTKYFPEYSIATNALIGDIRNENNIQLDGITGRCDLLIIDPNGNVEIIDYKVSSRAYADWDAAKAYHNDYLLGMYRAILAANGIDGSKVKLKILPIHFTIGKFVSTATVENILDRCLFLQRGVPHLDWLSGQFTNNLRCIILTPIMDGVIEDTNIREDFLEILDDLLGAYSTEDENTHQLTKEELAKRLFPKTDSRGVTIWGLFDINLRAYVYKPTKLSFIETNGYIDSMLAIYLKRFKNLMTTLVTQFKLAQDINNTLEIDLLDASKDQSKLISSVIQTTLGKYCNPNYKLCEIPELIDMGILIFLNMLSPGSSMYDVVRVTQDNLRLEPGINGTQTVLGKFLSANEAALLTDFLALPANIANIQLLETMAVLNLCESKLRRFKLNKLAIINPMLGQAEPAPNMDLLKANFNYLCTRGNRVNNFNNSLLTVSMWEMLLLDISDIVASPRILDRTKTLISDLDYDAATTAAKINLIIRTLKRLEEQNPRLLAYTDVISKRSFETPEEKLYVVLSMALMYYRNMPVRFDGKIALWGLHIEEGIRLLGIPFNTEYRRNLKSGEKSVGFGQGLDMGTPTSSASSNLAALFLYWDNSFLHIRKLQDIQLNYINNLCVDFLNNRTSLLQRALINNSNVYESLFEKDPQTGKRATVFKFLNPWDNTNSLMLDERDFLKKYLWEINKYLMPNISDDLRKLHYEGSSISVIDNLDVVKDWKNSGRYYNVPLRKASSVTRLKHITKIGLSDFFSKIWDSLRDEFDPRQLHGSARTIINSQKSSITEMYNQYKMSEFERNTIISTEGVYDFETELSFLAGDVAFLFERKRLFEDALIHANAMAMVMHFLQDTSDADFENELSTLDNQIKVSIKNETIWKKELDEVAKGIGGLKKLNSLLVLSVRPLLAIKELTYGQLTNYSRAWQVKGTAQEFSAADLFKANLYIWGNLIVGWAKSVTGEADIASFVLALKLNLLYGIANQDLNSIVEKNSLKRTGLASGIMKYLFAANSLPDFPNRLALFVAKMIHDGCLEAHHLSTDGILIYDVKKDKRFNKLVQYGLLYNSTDQEYLDQRAIYKAMLLEFMEAGYTKENGQPLSLEDTELYLPLAYTPKLKRSMKELSDLAYGYYDHEAKSLNDHKFVGLIFKLFMAFWTAKTQLWLRAPGSNTALGKYVFKKAFNPDTGKEEFVYKKVLEDPDTGELYIEETFDSENGTLEKQTEWQGEYVEGLIYSVFYLIKDIFKWNWTDIVGNPQRIGNLKLALHDLLIGLIMYNILKMIFSDGSGKMQDLHPAERCLVRAMLDVGPQSIWGLSLTPSFISTFEKVKRDLPALFTEDEDKLKILNTTIGAIKDITWSLH